MLYFPRNPFRLGTILCKNIKVINKKSTKNLTNQAKRENKVMNIGDRVRVVTSVIVYHYPKQKKQPFDLKGFEGEVIDIVQEWRGRPISANLPILVKFDDKFKAHFRENELEVLA